MSDAGGILIAGTGSGCGKTTLTCGLLRALQRRGISPCAFKCGPDYIDPSFHSQTLGVPCYNLDPFFTDKELLRQLYEGHSREARISVVEGVMGYYDGLGFSDEASTYTVACALELPVILLVNCEGMGSSLLALVEGYLNHRNPSLITGVIFNRLSSALYERARAAVQELGIAVFGYLPAQEAFRFESRHLGLVMAEEIPDFGARLDRLAESLEQTVDVEGILRLAAESARAGQREGSKVGQCEGGGEGGMPEPLRIAVARDEAFCFLYEDNLNFLRERGAQMIPFSPLHDQALPARCDALYLSGGYPELFAGQLAENLSMRESVRRQIQAGLPCIAECGGFLYLHRGLEADGRIYEMTGVICADALPKNRKGHFGYIEARLQKDCLLGEKGTMFRAHEFHYWESGMERGDISVVKPGNGAAWQEGICTETLYAGFLHLYFYGSPHVGGHFLAAAEAYRERKNSGGRGGLL